MAPAVLHLRPGLTLITETQGGRRRPPLANLHVLGMGGERNKRKKKKVELAAVPPAAAGRETERKPNRPPLMLEYEGGKKRNKDALSSSVPKRRMPEISLLLSPIPTGKGEASSFLLSCREGRELGTIVSHYSLL